MTKIALATCRRLPDWEVDDAPLHEALSALGVEVLRPAWDDPEFDWAACDACLIRTTWDYVPRQDAYVAWADHVATMTRLFNPPEIVRWNTHKGYLRDLELREVPVIPTIWFKAGREPHWREELIESGWSKAFIKPVVGAAAHDTLRFEVTPSGLDEAARHLSLLAPGRPMMLQPYLPGVETEGEYSVILIDGAVTHSVRKYPVPGDYRVQDDHGGKDEPAKLGGDDLALAKRIVAVAEDWVEPKHRSANGESLLYARVDFLRDEAGRLCVTELELVEPSLFFRHSPEAAARLASALICRLKSAR